MHAAAEKGSLKACEVILNLRLDAVYDTDKKVHMLCVSTVRMCIGILPSK